MDKTLTDSNTSGGRPSNSENPPSFEAGLADSGGGQSLLNTYNTENNNIFYESQLEKNSRKNAK